WSLRIQHCDGANEENQSDESSHRPIPPRRLGLPQALRQRSDVAASRKYIAGYRGRQVQMVGAGLLRKGERGKPACPPAKPVKFLRVLGMDDYRDRHRGGGHPPTPATPPCVRVRTRRFETVTLHSSTKVGSPRSEERRVGKERRFRW